jgi:hypothetical protein
VKRRCVVAMLQAVRATDPRRPASMFALILTQIHSDNVCR